jgi:hypothetical protein
LCRAFVGNVTAGGRDPSTDAFDFDRSSRPDCWKGGLIGTFWKI